MHTAPLPTADAKRFGPYVLISEIARGTFGRLWTACRRLDSGETEAVLVRRLAKRPPLDANALEQIKRAAELSTPVQAEHLARLRGVEETEEEIGLVFDYIDGKDLKSLLGLAPLKHMRMPPAVALHVTASALEALSVLRRELPEEFSTAALWPDCVFVGADGRTWLLDPSIAASIARTTGPKKYPQLVGYSSPEEFGDDDERERSDVFRAGILLWEMLAGKRLFTGGTTNTTVEQVLHAPIPPLEELAADHAPMGEIVTRALLHERAERYANSQELVRALADSGVPRASDADVAAFMTELVGTGLAAQQRAVAIALERVAVVEEGEGTETSPNTTIDPKPSPKTIVSEGSPSPPTRTETLLGVPAPGLLAGRAMPPPPPPPPRRLRPAPVAVAGGAPLDLTPIDDIESPLPSNPRTVRTEHSAIALLDSLESADIEPQSAPTEALSEDDLVEQVEDIAAPVSARPPEFAEELDSIAPPRQPRFNRKHVIGVAAALGILLLSVGVLAVMLRQAPTEETDPNAASSLAANAPPPPAPEVAPPSAKMAASTPPAASAPSVDAGKEAPVAELEDEKKKEEEEKAAAAAKKAALAQKQLAATKQAKLAASKAPLQKAKPKAKAKAKAKAKTGSKLAKKPATKKKPVTKKKTAVKKLKGKSATR